MKKWVLRGAAVVFVLLLIGAACFYFLRPGWHRAMTPGWFGMVEIAQDVFIDDAASKDSVLKIIRASRARVAEFFGDLKGNPRFVICTTSACQDRFGLRPAGLAVGRQVILLSPRGINQTIMTHELIHIELHQEYRMSEIFAPRFPSWFDEGLASLLSLDDRYLLPENPRDADWVTSALNYRDWNRLHRTRDWRQTYGAAARLVSELETKIGREALQEFVADVRNGADFNALWAENMGQATQ